MFKTNRAMLHLCGLPIDLALASGNAHPPVGVHASCNDAIAILSLFCSYSRTHRHHACHDAARGNAQDACIRGSTAGKASKTGGCAKDVRHELHADRSCRQATYEHIYPELKKCKQMQALHQAGGMIIMLYRCMHPGYVGQR